MEGHIGRFEVDPVADAAGQFVPVLLVAQYAGAARGVEGFDAVLLDLGAAVQPQLFLNLDFDRQAMGIPAAFALDAKALQGLVATEHVLDGAAQDVMDAGAPVGGWRPFVEGEGRRVATRRDAGAEGVFGVPHGEHRQF